MMRDVPYLVARKVVFHHVHPVTAWREYLGLSANELASLSDISPQLMATIEESNLHLKSEIQLRLCAAMKIKPYAINFRVQKSQLANGGLLTHRKIIDHIC